MAGPVANQPDLHLDPVAWPAEAVAIIGATKEHAAVEDGSRGHGLFTGFVLDWWRNTLRKGEPIEDLGQSLLGHTTKQLERVHSRQKPVLLTKSQVKFGREVHWPELGQSARILPIDSMYSPSPTEDEERSLGPKLKEETKQIRDLLMAVPKSIEDSNILIVSDRLMSTRWKVDDAARALAVNRMVVSLGANSLQTALPFLCVLEAWRKRRWGELNWLREPPHLDFSLRGPIDALVKQLSEEHALVIVPHREVAPGDDVSYFLEKCFSDQQIKLCVIAHADEETPMIFRTRAHRRLFLGPPAIELDRQKPYEFRDQARFKIGSPRLGSWLRVLKLKKLPDDLRMRLLENPHSQVAVIIDLIKTVLDCLSKESEGTDALTLLRAMSVMRLPRPESLIEHLMESLRDGEVSAKQVTARVLLNQLEEFHLVDKSNPFLGDPTKPGDDSPESHVFFLHSLVQRAVREHERTDGAQKWHRHAGIAYEHALQSYRNNNQTWFHATWPKSILVHQAIYHFELSGDWQRAARILDEHWDCMVNSGYQEMVLRWLESHRYHWPRPLATDWKSVAPSLLCGDAVSDKSISEKMSRILELKLLVHEQSLRRHRQEFAGIVDIHNMVVARTGAELRNWRWTVQDQDLEPYFWQSLAGHGDFLLIRRNYVQAMATYNDCLFWANTRPNITEAQQLKSQALLRLAHCYASHAMVKECRKVLDEDRNISSRRSKNVRVLAAECDLFRITEDSRHLYHKAVELWNESLRPTSDQDEPGKNNLNLAMARMHLGWACLMRGETARAWHHCLHARQYLNVRGIAEHWWVAENERIAALAIAWTFYPWGRDNLQPWIKKRPAAIDDSTKRLMANQVPVQTGYLEKLITLCESENPWRVAELKSALGQMLYYVGEHRTGQDHLTQALRLAIAHRHLVHEGYVLEALALIETSSAASSDYWRLSARISATMGITGQCLRRVRNAAWEAFRHDESARSRHEFIWTAKSINDVTDYLRDSNPSQPRRKEPRYSCNAPVNLVCDGKDHFAGRLINVSEHGLYAVFEGAEPTSTPTTVEITETDRGTEHVFVTEPVFRNRPDNSFGLRGRLEYALPVYRNAFGKLDAASPEPVEVAI